MLKFTATFHRLPQLQPQLTWGCEASLFADLQLKICKMSVKMLSLRFTAYCAFSLAWATAIPPSFVFLLTGDQDVLMDSMQYMPATRRILTEQGMSFPWSFAAVPVCCPSRSSLQVSGLGHSSDGDCCSGYMCLMLLLLAVRHVPAKYTCVQQLGWGG
jgi:hypothetical protein